MMINTSSVLLYSFNNIRSLVVVMLIEYFNPILDKVRKEVVKDDVYFRFDKRIHGFSPYRK